MTRQQTATPLVPPSQVTTLPKNWQNCQDLWWDRLNNMTLPESDNTAGQGYCLLLRTLDTNKGPAKPERTSTASPAPSKPKRKPLDLSGLDVSAELKATLRAQGVRFTL